MENEKFSKRDFLKWLEGRLQYSGICNIRKDEEREVWKSAQLCMLCRIREFLDNNFVDEEEDIYYGQFTREEQAIIKVLYPEDHAISMTEITQRVEYLLIGYESPKAKRHFFNISSAVWRLVKNGFVEVHGTTWEYSFCLNKKTKEKIPIHDWPV